MNFVQKYFLYRNLINPGPTTSKKNESISDRNFTRIDWTYSDNKNTYKIKSFKLDSDKKKKHDYDFYSAFVYLNGKEVAIFAGGRMARNMYDMAAAVMDKTR